MPWLRSIYGFALLVIAGMTGCVFAPHPINVGHLGPPTILEVHDGGKVKRRAIDPNSPEAKEFTDWLRRHKSGWTGTIATYVPSRLIEGDDFTLDFKGDACVINYRTSLFNYWNQYRRPLDAHEALPSLLTSPE